MLRRELPGRVLGRLGGREPALALGLGDQEGAGALAPALREGHEGRQGIRGIARGQRAWEKAGEGWFSCLTGLFGLVFRKFPKV